MCLCMEKGEISAHIVVSTKHTKTLTNQCTNNGAIWLVKAKRGEHALLKHDN